MLLPDKDTIYNLAFDMPLARQGLQVWADNLMANGGPEAIKLGVAVADMLRDTECYIAANFTTFESAIRIKCEGKYQEEVGPAFYGRNGIYKVKSWYSTMTIDLDRTYTVLGFHLDLIKDLD